MYTAFLENGLCVIPLKQGVPVVKWSDYFYELPAKQVVSGWSGNEYGLVCGTSSNVIALDIDTDEPIGQSVYALAGETPVRKVGSKGFTAFYRYDGEASNCWKSNGKAIIELLSDKRITTIPPSPHRKTGKPYTWSADDIIGAELPCINSDVFTFLDARFPKPRYHVPDYQPRDFDDVSLSQAAEMLDYISSDCPRDDWLKIGMALRDEFGDAACTLFHQWSAKAGKRYNQSDCQAVWRSFTREGVTIGTLVYLAQQNGWNPNVPEVDSFSYGNPDKVLPPPPTPPEIERPPGVLGDMMDYILETALYPRPQLALASSIATLDTVS